VSVDSAGGFRNGAPVSEPEHVRPGDADLTALLARLGDDVVRLVDGKLSLIKLDVEEQVRAHVRAVTVGAIAAVVVAVGVTLVAAGVAFAVAAALPASLDPLLARAIAFALVGAVGIGAGVAVLRRKGTARG
jgi:uncharacterized membrane protein YqjE